MITTTTHPLGRAAARQSEKRVRETELLMAQSDEADRIERVYCRLRVSFARVRIRMADPASRPLYEELSALGAELFEAADAMAKNLEEYHRR